MLNGFSAGIDLAFSLVLLTIASGLSNYSRIDIRFSGFMAGASQRLATVKPIFHKGPRVDESQAPFEAPCKDKFLDTLRKPGVFGIPSMGGCSMDGCERLEAARTQPLKLYKVPMYAVRRVLHTTVLPHGGDTDGCKSPASRRPHVET